MMTVILPVRHAFFTSMHFHGKLQDTKAPLLSAQVGYP
jgi:hypothetical protein